MKPALALAGVLLGATSLQAHLNINFSPALSDYTPVLFPSTVPPATTAPAGLNAGATFLFENVGTFNSQSLDAVLRFESFHNSEVGISLGPIGDADAAQSLGFDLRGRASADQYTVFSLRFVEAGSATDANPLGTIANITERIVIQSFDIDSNGGQNFTDVFGFHSSSTPDFRSPCRADWTLRRSAGTASMIVSSATAEPSSSRMVRSTSPRGFN